MSRYFIIYPLIVLLSVLVLVIFTTTIINEERRKHFIFDEETLDMITLYDWHKMRRTKRSKDIKDRIKNFSISVRKRFNVFAAYSIRDVDVD